MSLCGSIPELLAHRNVTARRGGQPLDEHAALSMARSQTIGSRTERRFHPPERQAGVAVRPDGLGPGRGRPRKAGALVAVGFLLAEADDALMQLQGEEVRLEQVAPRQCWATRLTTGAYEVQITEVSPGFHPE